MKTIKKFYASWCVNCSALDITLKDVLEDKIEYNLVAVDVDKNADQVKEYGLTNIPVLICVNESNVELARFIGNGSSTELEQWLQAMQTL